MKTIRYVRASIIALLLVLSPLAPTAHAATLGGRAFGLLVDLPSLGILPPITLSDTGALPAVGGTRTAFLVNASVSHDEETILTATTMGDTTQGSGYNVRTVAETQSLSLLPGHAARVTADVIRSVANATCVSVSGSSVITNLTFGGLKVIVTGQPNQMVAIPGVATLIINEQISSVGPNEASITVNGLHLILFGGNDEVIVSSARSSVSGCPGPVPVQATTWSTLKTRLAN